MADPAGRFGDILPRLLSAAVMIVVAGLAIVIGGTAFRLLVGVAVAAMIYELHRMMAPRADGWVAPALGGGAGAGLFALAWGGDAWLAIAAVLFGAGGFALTLPAAGWRRAGAAGAAAVLLAGLSLILLRDGPGALWLLWLVLIVIGSDVSGYFAGRLIGGPRFWPAISPKKTWSGTVAGWIMAVVIGALFMGPLQAGPALLAVSLLVAVAGQMGDIAESALKRRVGVKDSSALIPGHGGVLDRLDAMMGAALAWLVLAQIGVIVAVTGG